MLPQPWFLRRLLRKQDEPLFEGSEGRSTPDFGPVQSSTGLYQSSVLDTKLRRGRPWHALSAVYAYDFGDDWEHLLVHEGMEPEESALAYPRCASGARRCPPEDCGGVHGYADFLETIANPRHPEHASMKQWAGGAYDPDAFDPTAVVFDDPRKRWKQAFEE